MEPLHSILEKSNFASIDIGSHTIRLLIVSYMDSEGLFPIRSERRITRLAREFQKGELLGEASMRESLKVLKEYGNILRECKARSTIAGATGVVRKAANREAFIETIYKEAGIRARILSETDEAFLSAKGILSALTGLPNPVIAFDLGGSSTEILLIDADKPQPLWSTSVFIGAATISERFLRKSPADQASLREAEAFAQETLAPVLTELRSRLADLGNPSFELVGTAGTVTTLAAMNLEMKTYEPHRVNNLQMTAPWLQEIIEKLAHMPVASRSELPGLEKGREDIILGGALIVRAVLRGLSKEALIVSDAGLLEGLAVYLVEDELRQPHNLGSAIRCHW
jgi:exopolyphosphatase/guanosine-5'-triphosphate,3'-diphosphate pyrophosphatase